MPFFSDIGYEWKYINAVGDDFFTSVSGAGVKVYSTDLIVIKSLDSSEVGNVRLAHIDWESNMMALVVRVDINEDEVLVWDCDRKKLILAYSAPDPVLSVKIRNFRIFLCTRYEIRVSTVSTNPRIMKIFQTGENTKGLFSMTPSESANLQIMAFPAACPGAVRIMALDALEKMPRNHSIVQAHNSDLSYIALNKKGTLMATTSIKGTLIRVFDTQRKDKLYELRRGSEYADIFCVNFSPCSEYICVSSSRPTVHLFSLRDARDHDKSSWLGGFRSFATAKVNSGLKTICFFSSNLFYVIYEDGSVRRYRIRDGKLDDERTLSIT